MCILCPEDMMAIWTMPHICLLYTSWMDGQTLISQPFHGTPLHSKHIILLQACTCLLYTSCPLSAYWIFQRLFCKVHMSWLYGASFKLPSYPPDIKYTPKPKRILAVSYTHLSPCREQAPSPDNQDTEQMGIPWVYRPLRLPTAKRSHNVYGLWA